MILETDVEHDFCREAKRRGLWAIKLNPLGFTGLPDRLLIGPKKFICFVELKRPRFVFKKKLTKQKWVHQVLRRFGFDVYIIRSKKEVTEFFHTAQIPRGRSKVATR